MNRAEKWNQDKMYKKKMQWAESLRPWQKEFINDALADARATIETEVVSNLDTIITAALVEKTDLSLKEIFDINVTVGEFYGRIRYENSIKKSPAIRLNFWFHKLIISLRIVVHDVQL